MILGVSTATFTLVHVVISLIGIFSGLVVLFGMLGSRKTSGWTALFLVSTVLTSATGFFFHSATFGPAHVVGVISLLALTVAIISVYIFRLAGAWRWVYVIGAVAALYFNVFVLIAQAFAKVPALKALAPAQTEPAFLFTQIGALAIFVALMIVAMVKFHSSAT